MKPYQIVVLGQGNVGKTTLSKNLKVKDVSEPTIGADFSTREIFISNEKEPVKLQIWDTAGQEIYRSVCKNYYRKADCAIVVFELSNLDSWNTAQYWITELRQYDSTMGIVLVGNKSDLIPFFTIQQTVNWAQIWDEAVTVSTNLKIPLFATSNKSGDSVQQCLESVAKEARKKREKDERAESSAQIPLFRPAPITLGDRIEKRLDKISCCKN